MIINKKDFLLKIKKNKYSIIDFWAPWCSPCIYIKDIINEVMYIYKNKIKCYKINIDKNNFLSKKYNILSIPTLIFFIKGKEKKRNIGILTKKKLINLCEKIINNN
ncbi:MAG: thioredoxin domain-containing protein [Candidatus Shikimatogenerans bostrichidophilus]|nr:MAG: thioredoxin domain-containing protein [Candidatus Shikimatogenerans bostrichidophilus]